VEDRYRRAQFYKAVGNVYSKQGETDKARDVLNAGVSVSGVDESGMERYLLLPVLAGLAAHRSARSAEARRPLLEAQGLHRVSR
jgi:hypothetical protein